MRRDPALLVAFVCALAAGHEAAAQADRTSAVLASPAFQERFQTYFGRTTRRPIGQLNAYLASAVEDLFLNTSHVSTVSLAADVRGFQRVLLTDLRGRLCPGSPPTPPRLEDLKPAIVRGVVQAAAASSLSVSDGDCGRLAGIVASIVLETTRPRLCGSRSFGDLE